MPYPSKNTSTPTLSSKNSASFSVSDQSSNNYLLLENGDFLLLEDGGRIILDELSGWSYQTKN